MDREAHDTLSDLDDDELQALVALAKSLDGPDAAVAAAEVGRKHRDRSTTRRDLLKAGGAVGVGALLGGGATGVASAQADDTDSVPDVGTPSQPVDVFGDGISANSVSADQINSVESVDPAERDIGTVAESAPAGTIVIAENGTHTPASNITVPDSVGVHLRPNATIQAPDLPDGEPFIKFAANYQFLTGSGTIDGNQAGQSVLNTGQAAVSIEGAENFLLNGPEIVDAPGGDGIYITSLRESLLTNFRVDGGYRNGITIISGRDFTLSNFTASNTTGTSPQAGVDVEPNAAGQSLSRVTIENFKLASNADQGMQVHTANLNATDTVDLTIRDGYAVNNDDGFDFARAFNGSPGIFAESLRAADNTTFGFNIGAAGPLYLRETVAKNNGARNYESSDTDTVAADNPIIEDGHSISTGSTTDRSANLRGSGTITLDGFRITGSYATGSALTTDSGIVKYRNVERTDGPSGALNFPSRMEVLQKRLRDIPGATASDLSAPEVAVDSTNGRIVWKDETGSAYYVSGTAL